MFLSLDTIVLILSTDTSLLDVLDTTSNKISLVSIVWTRIVVGYFFSITSFHETSINLSSRFSTFGHIILCTVIPYPLVIYPVILSPGTGLQQEAILTLMSSIP